MSYPYPGVFIEETSTGTRPISGVGTTVAGFVGIAQRGPVKIAKLITSWTQYVNEYAKGLASPFFADSYLPYAVYGFFLNGGTRCYVSRAASSTSAKASVNWVDSSAGIPYVFRAIDEGTWANGATGGLSVKATVTNEQADVNVYLGNSLMETFTDCNFTLGDRNYVINRINGVSKYVNVVKGASDKAPVSLSTAPLAGGADGVSDIADTDYVGADGAIHAFDALPISMVAVPGVSSVALSTIQWAENKKYCMALIEPPFASSTPEQAVTFRSSLSSTFGHAAIYWPWIEVSDPVGTNATRTKWVPPTGHVAGVMARTDAERGVWKAPAGIQAVVKGALDLAYKPTPGEIATTFGNQINHIVQMDGAGICIMGARTIASDSRFRYANVRRYLNYLEASLLQGTTWVINEPNDAVLWKSIYASVRGFLLTDMHRGAFKSRTPSRAFFVKCDAELNTDEEIEAGNVITEVGVAVNKPAEFVIFRVSQWEGGGTVVESAEPAGEGQ